MMTFDELTVGSLFSGIGGLDLGLERAGMRVVWQCEIDKYARRVLAEHWPGIPCYPDVRELGVTIIPERVDVLCGGFPCQDISTAGRRAGIHGERSGLFFEIVRLARVLRPRYIILENVAALTIRGLDTVLGELALCGYDAEWDCISAASIGALHRRDRMFIVAYRDSNSSYPFISKQGQIEGQSANARGSGEGGDMAYPMLDPEGVRPGAVPEAQGEVWGREEGRLPPGCGQVLAYPEGAECELAGEAWPGRAGASRGSDVPDTEFSGTGHIPRAFGGQGWQSTRALESEALRQGNGATLPEGIASSCLPVPIPQRLGGRGGPVRRDWVEGDAGPFERARRDNRIRAFGDASREWWAVEPDVGRVAHGVPSRVDRLKCLGNAVVPQVGEYVGRCVVDFDGRRRN
jgi:site-specific DNA-cytosine methylase